MLFHYGLEKITSLKKRVTFLNTLNTNLCFKQQDRGRPIGLGKGIKLPLIDQAVFVYTILYLLTSKAIAIVLVVWDPSVCELKKWRVWASVHQIVCLVFMCYYTGWGMRPFTGCKATRDLFSIRTWENVIPHVWNTCIYTKCKCTFSSVETLATFYTMCWIDTDRTSKTWTRTWNVLYNSKSKWRVKLKVNP